MTVAGGGGGVVCVGGGGGLEEGSGVRDPLYLGQSNERWSLFSFHCLILP